MTFPPCNGLPNVFLNIVLKFINGIIVTIIVQLQETNSFSNLDYELILERKKGSTFVFFITSYHTILGYKRDIKENV